MIQSLSRLKIADNSGVKEIMVIQVLGRAKGGKFQHSGTVGELVSASAKSVQPNSEFKQGDIVHAVVVRTKKEIRRKDGSYVRFDDNAAVIIEKESGEPKATRIFGPIARELKEKGFNKIISLAPEVL